MQGHTGSAVSREAAENLTPLFQPVTDGSSPWRGRRETHKIDCETSVKFPHLGGPCVGILRVLHAEISELSRENYFS